jgi:Fibronectin type III domain
VTDRLGRLRCRFITIPVTTALILTGCAASGVLDASWVAPITNADGSPLTDVVSYRVYYSTTEPPCPTGSAIVAAAPKVPLPSDQRLVVRLTGLTVGKLYYVAVTAVNSRGIASTCSSTVSARARQP